VGESLADDALRALGHRQLGQQAHDAAVDILQRETLAVGRLPQAPDQVADQVHREIGLGSDEPAQVSAAHH
jgi:hypothetical protein